jgi:hypothetical protein
VKQFLIWLFVFTAAYAGISIYYHQYLEDNPKKLIIAVDESYKMNNQLPRIKEQILSLKERNYTVFSVVTSQRKIHDWESRPELDNFQPFGPRDFEQLIENMEPLSEDADEIIVITNAEDITLLKNINNVNIVRIHPLTE